MGKNDTNTVPPEGKKDETIKKAAEVWASELRTPSWQLAALKQHMKLAEGKQLTQTEFQTGLRSAINKPVGR